MTFARGARSKSLWRVTLCSFFYAFETKEGTSGPLQEGGKKQGEV